MIPRSASKDGGQSDGKDGAGNEEGKGRTGTGPALLSSTVLLAPSFPADFLLVSEFSELEGPIPLFSIPPKAEGTFNLNDFVLRIMAVDYQSSRGDGSPIMEDTQVVLSEPSEDAYAYVHHITLLDINARGYVRPICISFITHDPHKIMNHFEELSNEFFQVSEAMKKGNRRLFQKELEEKMAGLRATQEAITRKRAQSPGSTDSSSGLESEPADSDGSPFNPNSVTEFLEELEKMWQKVREVSDDDDYPQEGEVQTPSESPSPFTNTPSSISRSATPFQEASPEKGLDKDLQQTTDEEPDEEGKYSSFGASSSQPEETTKDVLNSVKGIRNFNKRLRTLDELCLGNFAPVRKFMEKIQRHYSRPDILLTLEHEDSLLLSPSGSLLTLGRTPIINFSWEVHAPRANRRDSVDSSLTRKRGASKTSSRSRLSTSMAGTSPLSSVSSNDSISSVSSITDSPSLLEEDFEEAMENLHNKLTESSITHSAPSHVLIAPSLDVSSTIADPDSDDLRPLRVLAPYRAGQKPKLWTVESFASVLWDCSKFGAGKGINEVRLKYIFAKHLIFSLLKGRPVVIYASAQNEKGVRNLIGALSLFVPGFWKNPLINPWRTTSLKMSDLASTKLVGLMKATGSIPKSVEKYVSILDFEKEELKAPLYSKGDFIEDMLSTKKFWPDEETYLAFCHYKLLDFSMKSCLYYHLCCIGVPAAAGSAEQQAANQATSSTGSFTDPLSAFLHITTGHQSRDGSIGHIGQSAPRDSNLLGSKEASQSSNKNDSLTSSRDSLFSSTSRESTSSNFSHLAALQNRVNEIAGLVTGNAPRRSYSESQIPAFSPLVKEQSNIKFFKDMNIQEDDAKIVEHLAELIKEQQAIEFAATEPACPVIRLDYTPCMVFRNFAYPLSQSQKRT